MSLLAIDLGGTKLAFAVISLTGELKSKEVITLNRKPGNEPGEVMIKHVRNYLTRDSSIQAIGIAVPGIYNKESGTVWAPNIRGWENYPLLSNVEAAVGGIPVAIDSDRACYISGELWKGNARGCKDAIYLSVGTGIGAGILIDGKILRGANDIAGAIGWMALKAPFNQKYKACGCFEYHASGEGIARVAMEKLDEKRL